MSFANAGTKWAYPGLWAKLPTSGGKGVRGFVPNARRIFTIFQQK